MNSNASAGDSHSSIHQSNSGANLGTVELLSVIAPVHNNEGRITVRVEELLDILTDAHVPFEFLLLDFASTDSTTDLISELGRLYPQIKCVYFPNLDINGAISSAIKAAEGDLIVILEEGDYAIHQLTQLLQDSLQIGHQVSQARDTTQPAEPVLNVPSPVTEEASIDPDQYDLSGRNFGREMTIPELPGIESRVLQRLEDWANALKREAAQRDIRSETLAQETVESEFLPAQADEIRRLDPSETAPKRKLPKFITRFHEFI